MRDAFITYHDGRRVAVSDLPLDQVQRLEARALILKPTGASDRTPEQLRERLRIELVIRSRRLNCLI
jgi:hypothetical protein